MRNGTFRPIVYAAPGTSHKIILYAVRRTIEIPHLGYTYIYRLLSFLCVFAYFSVFSRFNFFFFYSILLFFFSTNKTSRTVTGRPSSVRSVFDAIRSRELCARRALAFYCCGGIERVRSEAKTIIIIIISRCAMRKKTASDAVKITRKKKK